MELGVIHPVWKALDGPTLTKIVKHGYCTGKPKTTARTQQDEYIDRLHRDEKIIMLASLKFDTSGAFIDLRNPPGHTVKLLPLQKGGHALMFDYTERAVDDMSNGASKVKLADGVGDDWGLPPVTKEHPGQRKKSLRQREDRLTGIPTPFLERVPAPLRITLPWDEIELAINIDVVNVLCVPATHADFEKALCRAADKGGASIVAKVFVGLEHNIHLPEATIRAVCRMMLFVLK